MEQEILEAEESVGNLKKLIEDIILKEFKF